MLFSSKSILRFTTWLFGVTGLLFSMLAHSGTYKFEYTSDLYGKLGYFTVDESEFSKDNGSYFPVFLQNEAIDDLSFHYQGYEWGVEDVLRGSSISFTRALQSRIPQVRNTSNSLADNGIAPITVYINGVLNIGTTYGMTGNWTTTYITAIPEPKEYSMIAVGLVLMTISLRKKEASSNA